MAEQLAGTATIRLKLQLTPQDKAVLDGLGAGPGRAAGAGGRDFLTSPSGRAPTVPGGRGGPSLLSGMTLGRLGALGVGAAFAAPLIGDAASVVGGTFGGYGRLASEALGLGGLARNARVPEGATRATVGQLGIAGAYASPDQIRALREVNRRMLQMEADAETKIRGAVGGDTAKNINDLMRQALDMFIAHWPAVVAAIVAKGLLGKLPGPVGKLARII
jgi:hypothetical protein